MKDLGVDLEVGVIGKKDDDKGEEEASLKVGEHKNQVPSLQRLVVIVQYTKLLGELWVLGLA